MKTRNRLKYIMPALKKVEMDYGGLHWDSVSCPVIDDLGFNAEEYDKHKPRVLDMTRLTRIKK